MYGQLKTRIRSRSIVHSPYDCDRYTCCQRTRYIPDLNTARAFPIILQTAYTCRRYAIMSLCLWHGFQGLEDVTTRIKMYPQQLSQSLTGRLDTSIHSNRARDHSEHRVKLSRDGLTTTLHIRLTDARGVEFLSADFWTMTPT